MREQQQQYQRDQQQLGNHLLDFNLTSDRGSGRPSSVHIRAVPPPPLPPVRRFVPRFSVHSTAADWVGSTGPGTPLWCEYLSPWVLRKKVETILLNDGIESLVSPQFRRSSPASATIFWNLVVWFMEFSLPLGFLLQESIQGAASAPFY